VHFNHWFKYYKVQLLCRAWGEGLGSFLREFWLIFRDALMYRVRLVYEASLNDIAASSTGIKMPLEMRRFGAWSEIDEPMRQGLAANPHEFGWDVEKVLAQGWRMWTGTLGSDLVFVCWTRDKSCCDAFYVPLKDGETLLCSAATANGFRGRGIFKSMLIQVAAHLKNEGGTKLYIECLDSNTASRRGIEHTGFRRMGRVIYWRIFDHLYWIPEELIQGPVRTTDGRPRAA
jgi:GNAT superfamily N-acetyltransferase